jgi:cysteine-rich repeat protein
MWARIAISIVALIFLAVPISAAAQTAAHSCPECMNGQLLARYKPQGQQCNGTNYAVISMHGSLNNKSRENKSAKTIVQEAMDDWNDPNGSPSIPYKWVLADDPQIAGCNLAPDYEMKEGYCTQNPSGAKLAFACIPKNVSTTSNRTIVLAGKNFGNWDELGAPVSHTADDVKGRVAHEIAHTMGLASNHDCDQTSDSKPIVSTVIGGSRDNGKREGQESGRQFGSNSVTANDRALVAAAHTNLATNGTLPPSQQDCKAEEITTPEPTPDPEPDPDPYCGDNHTDEGEQCDDGGNDNGDGCSSTCQNEGEGGGPGGRWTCGGPGDCYFDDSGSGLDQCSPSTAIEYCGDPDPCDGATNSCQCLELTESLCDEMCGYTWVGGACGSDHDCNCNDDNDDCDIWYGECLAPESVAAANYADDELVLAQAAAGTLFLGGLIRPRRRLPQAQGGPDASHV